MDIQKHIEENLPNYSDCNKVLRSDLLSRFVNGELDPVENADDLNAIKSEIAEILLKANDLELLEECP